MPFRKSLQTALIAAAAIAGAGWTARLLLAQGTARPVSLEASFAEDVKPFFAKRCTQCHNENLATSGVRVDGLDASLEERHIPFWEQIRQRVEDGTMPPKGLPQPTAEERAKALAWVNRALETARTREVPKNGMVRRLTVAQYRNTLRELLALEDDFTEILPPDAVSKDGFLNNKETLQLSPILVETYLEIAEDALGRAIVDEAVKPKIQKFRMELGESINPDPFPEKLILGANSLLLENKDFTVTQPKPEKPFAFEPVSMRTKFRYIEGYQGNDTVRGWREYDSIYHAVFACMRGSRGYPKGTPYTPVKEGLLLRPAIPNDELFQADGTYGPKANFKISLRELPDRGRFRVTVMAAKYNDGLLLDAGATARAEGAASIAARDPKQPQTVTIPAAGVYQVDVHAGARRDKPPTPDVSRLNEQLAGSWPLDEAIPGAAFEGEAKLVKSPFGQAVSLNGMGDSVTIPRTDALSIGEGDFTIAAWIQPRQLRKAGIIASGAVEWTQGWYLDMPDNRGVLRLETTGADNLSNGSVTSPPGVLRINAWQHVAAVVKRGGEDTTILYVNGYPVARGRIGKGNLDNPRIGLHLGRIPKAQQFRGQLDEVRIYRRALDEAELQALIEPGRRFVRPPPEKPQEVTLELGGRNFAGVLQQAAFLAVRLPAGKLALTAKATGVRDLDRVVLTPIGAGDDVTKRFAAFEKRTPKLGVHMGFRRDCGSTFARVGTVQTVKSGELTPFVFEGAIRNYPRPEVEKDNVNYLAGVHELAVRSEYTDGRDMPRLVVRSVEFEGPYYDAWPPAPHKNIFVESPRKGETAAYAREVIRRFATKAFRRPVTKAEEAALVGVFTKSRAAGAGFQQSVKDALQVVLTSPQFLFLIEMSATPKPEPLDNYELASKLSYFLWNSPPDSKTLGLASAGTLRKRLDAEVDRMVADGKFARFIDEFAAQWLSLEKFDVLEPDKTKFPKLTRDTRAHLRREPVEFLAHLMRNNLPVSNLIASDFVMANEAVADYYGFGGKTEEGFRFVPVAHGRQELGGLLAQPAILAGLSNGRESNPVKRGAWMARKIIAEPPSDPPPNVPALKEEEGANLTLRERIEQHRNQAGCRQCHTKIDPWGVALEQFDADGKLKAKAADARSTLPDRTEVAGFDDLRQYLVGQRTDQVAFSVLKHLATYAAGRSLTYNELSYLKEDGVKLRADGYRLKDMVRYVVNSRMFLEK